MRDFGQIVRDIETRPDMTLLRQSDHHLVFRYNYVSPRGRRRLTVRLCTEGGWDQVAVQDHMSLPSWAALNDIKQFVLNPDEWMMQLHVPPEDQYGAEETSLFLWRPQDMDFPLPPPGLVHN